MTTRITLRGGEPKPYCPPAAAKKETEILQWADSLNDSQLASAFAIRCAVRVLPCCLTPIKSGGRKEVILLNVLRSISLNLAFLRQYSDHASDLIRISSIEGMGVALAVIPETIREARAYFNNELRIRSTIVHAEISENAAIMSMLLCQNIAFIRLYRLRDLIECASKIVENIEILFQLTKPVDVSAKKAFRAGEIAQSRIRKACFEDTKFIAEGDSAAKLLQRPLWPDGKGSWCDGAPRTKLPSLSPWGVWKNLLEGYSKEGAISDRELFAYCAVPEPVWAEGAKPVSDYIKKLLKSGNDDFIPKDKKIDISGWI